jgi:hypothetical protein
MAERKFAALAGLKQQLPVEQLPEQRAALPTATLSTHPGRGKGRPPGKRSNPEYQATTLLLKEHTKRTATRLLEDKKLGKDLSDLTEQLLTEWIQHQQGM